MFGILRKIPPYAYLAGFIGATATYLLYTPSVKSKMKKAKLNGHPRGLINYKNECFINVILQSLASSNKVIDWLTNTSRSVTITTTAGKKSTNNLFDTLAKVLSRINRIEIKNSSSASDDNLSTLDKNDDFDEDQLEFYAAQNVKRALNAHNWQIQSEEHDCHELFHLIMDCLNEEQLEKNISLKSLNYFMPSNLRENSRISTKNPFHGYLLTQLECLDCAYKYPLRLESFYSLSLNFPQTKPNILNAKNFIDSLSMSGFTLYELFYNYFKPEYLTEMKCENCTSNNTTKTSTKKYGFIKKQAIAKLPECLAIHIQRNSWSGNNLEMIKQTNYVQFPLNIKIDSVKNESSSKLTNKNDLSNLSSYYLTNSQFSLKQVGIGGLLGGKSLNKKNNDVKPTNSINVINTNEPKHRYELKSAVVHYGSAHSGHFVAYRKPLNQMPNNKSDEWLQISDNTIKRVKQTNLLNSNVYMLFYEKVLHSNGNINAST